MAKQTINIGSGELTGDGESLRSAFDKINDNFNELYLKDTSDFDGQFSSLTGTPTTIAGYGINDAYTKAEVDSSIASVTAGNFDFNITGDDSTVRTVTSGSTLQITGGTAITTASDVDGNITINGVAQDFAFSSLTGTPTTIAGYGITDAFDGNYNSLTNQPTIPTDINDLTDVDTNTISPSVSGQPLIWDTVDSNWYPGTFLQVASINVSTAIQVEDGAYINFEGATDDANETRLTVSDPTADRTITLPDASGTVALTTQLYTDSDVDTHLNQSNPTDGYVLSWTSGDYAWVAQSGGISGPALEGSSLQPADETSISTQGTTLELSGGDSTGLNSDGGDLTLVGGNGSSGTHGDISIGATQTGSITIGSGSNNVDFPSGTTVDFTGATVTGLSVSGLQSRSTATGTTSSLADAAEANLDITGFKSYMLLTVTTDRAARVRLYTTGAARTADASRAEGVDPTSDAGVIAEVITTGAQTVTISPGALGFNLEGTPTTNIPTRVTNKSGSTSTVQVDLNILQLEA